MSDLQKKLLEMLGWLIDFLGKNKLRYYIVGGTMLGAVRHNGFIPWDDDVDIAMPRSDYEQLIKLLEQPVDHYIVESVKSSAKDYLYSFAKFYDINTSMTEEARVKVRRGVYIDIFPLDGIGQTVEEARKNYKRIDRLNVLHAMRTCKPRKGRKWWKNLAVYLGYLIPFDAKKISAKLDKVCAKNNFDESIYVGNLMSTYREREIMAKSVYGNPTPYKFENIMVMGPEKADEYLTKIYGEWQKLPPEGKRVTHHDFICIDLTRGYINE